MVPLILLVIEGRNQLSCGIKKATQTKYFRFCSYTAKMKPRNK